VDVLSAELICSDLDTRLIGCQVVVFSAVSSTNSEARRLASEGVPEGTLVIAEYQTAGRGRLDRRWEAPPGSSLLLSLVLRPRLAPHQIQRLTMLCGLAVADAVEKVTSLRVGLKWPNDIVYGPAKLGGILTEVGLHGEQVDHVVVGIGLNVNLDPGQLPSDLQYPATSLSHEIGQPVGRLSLLQSMLRLIEIRYRALKRGTCPKDEWAQRLDTLGQHVTVSAGGTVLEGMAEGVDDDGALLVRLQDGRLTTVMAGDVSLRKP
jgi:BirA family biotin operon repressor/biotin-[acetyl-CoA-carboxylase] ligase